MSFYHQIEGVVGKKIALFHDSFHRYMVRSILGGVFLAMAAGGGAYVAAMFQTTSSALASTLFAFFFSFGLIFILFFGGELATSNMMYFSAGIYKKDITIKQAIKLLTTVTIFNAVGAICIAFLFSRTTAFLSLPQEHYLIGSVASKIGKSPLQIVFEGILANIFVNVAILASLLIKDTVARIFIIFGAIMLFVILGFEHVVANFVTFSIVKFGHVNVDYYFSWGAILLQWFYAFIGNLIGGGIVIGLTYAWLNDLKEDHTYRDRMI